jgi:hypothetical protein
MHSSGRNPIAQSLALAVLGVALVGALVLGAVVFAALFGVFIAGYLVTLAHAWWRLRRIRRRAAYVDSPQPQATIEGDLEVVEVAAEAASPGSGGAA